MSEFFRKENYPRMKMFETPEIKVIHFDIADVITTSEDPSLPENDLPIG